MLFSTANSGLLYVDFGVKKKKEAKGHRWKGESSKNRIVGEMEVE